ncbi:MAG: ParA family protein [Spiribacter salinus]|uniref:ParA family protein n=1 Tax=Spiribacter salinus TaxID=1335746 RepID=A0A540VST1_9GAMM|nr:MAG: ParA family protein [Spiribacter salinus]
MTSITFDQILSQVDSVLQQHDSFVRGLDWLVINRDLNGRTRFIVPESLNTADRKDIEDIGKTISGLLGSHGHTAEQMVLDDDSRETACQGASAHLIEGWNNVYLADRLTTEGDWASIFPADDTTKRIAFFSIKGGVGRSTALAMTAWSLAQAGKRILVLDLDLESPGLSSSLLPAEKQPTYGITDWLVEDLVDNGEVILDDMVATSDLAHDGEIYVVPSHGADPGDYVAKLSRVWMPKSIEATQREPWSARLRRLLASLEQRYQPDLVLLDSRAGIDEVAGACVTDLGANLVLIFALEGTQTWSGYRILFKHWQQTGNAEVIRQRLQLVGALVPETDPAAYTEALRDEAYTLFADHLYDEIPSGDVGTEAFHFDTADDTGPHAPWAIRWQRGLAGLRSLHGRLANIDTAEVNATFGPLLAGLHTWLGEEDEHA